MYSPTHWIYGENITVKQFCDYLQKHVPENALFCVAKHPKESSGGAFYRYVGKRQLGKEFERTHIWFRMQV